MTNQHTVYDLYDFGIKYQIRILGGLVKLTSAEVAPIVFLLDETHAVECIQQNLENSKELIKHCGISFAGVESHVGGLKWDDCYRHQYTTEFDNGINVTPINEYPQFADGLRNLGLPVFGVECQGLSNELECDLLDKPDDGPIANRQFNLARSEHFIRTLFRMRDEHGLHGNMILNVGGNHNTHISNWIRDGSIETKVGQKAAYVRLRAPAYRE
jgi:hypothetical protein